MSNVLQKKLDDGFTLVELMVVVAIIGLLSAVAIPNFRKYQAKSKMTEAKLQLSSLFTAQSAFFADYNIYSTCLSYMGYNPSPEKSQRYYAVGFNLVAATNGTAFAAAVNSGLQTLTGGSDTCSATEPLFDGRSWFSAGKGTGGSIASTSAFLDWTVIGTQATSNPTLPVSDATGTNADTGMVYRAAASGVIDGNFATDSTSSNLTIDNNKKMTIYRNGF